MVESMHPDMIAHKVVTNEGGTVRLYMQDVTARIPTEPFDGSSPTVTEIPLAYIDADINEAWVDDGGLLVDAFLGLSDAEWDRTNLGKHAEEVEMDVTSASRRLEFVAGRHSNLREFRKTDRDATFDPPVPETSPLLTQWDDSPEEIGERPPVPVEQPYIFFDIAWTENADRDRHAHSRIKLGRVVAAES